MADAIKLRGEAPQYSARRMTSGEWAVYRDGDIVAVVDTEDDANAWIGDVDGE